MEVFVLPTSNDWHGMVNPYNRQHKKTWDVVSYLFGCSFGWIGRTFESLTSYPAATLANMDDMLYNSISMAPNRGLRESAVAFPVCGSWCPEPLYNVGRGTLWLSMLEGGWLNSWPKNSSFSERKKQEWFKTCLKDFTHLKGDRWKALFLCYWT